ncbi:MAG: arylesterase [Cellvibrionaceae bacterium]|nr:arylesterase [Cellvibrionaceae bacterium]
MSAVRLPKLLLFLLLVLSPLSQAEGKTLLVLGDSISAAYGMEPKQGWVALLQRRLADKQLDVVNASISGETSAGGLARLPQLLQQFKPNYVVIELGGNDGLRGYPIGQMKANFKQMIELSQAAEAKVLMLGMQIPPNYGKRYARLFSQSFSAVAEQQQVPLLPFFLEKVALDKGLMQAAGIHPNAKAQPLLLETAWPMIEQLTQL